MLPFTVEQFFAVFAAYNEAIWPAQIVAYIAGAAAVILVFVRLPWSDRAISALLAAMWIWTGVAYHALFFTAINTPAWLFAALFVLQGLYLLFEGTLLGKIAFAARRDATAWIGYFFIVYAAILYPLIGLAAGHEYPAMPMFGVAPCPVTIFTFGMLMLATFSWRYLLILQVIWSFIGGSAAFLLDVKQDWLLFVSGVVTILALSMRRAAR